MLQTKEQNKKFCEWEKFDSTDHAPTSERQSGTISGCVRFLFNKMN
jgi:hypothetical protein